MVVEFSLYNVNTNLLAVFFFLVEFPVWDEAVSSMELQVAPLWPFTGLDLQLLLTVPACNPAERASVRSWPASLTSSPSDCPPGPGALLPGAGHHGLPERRPCLLAVRLESSGRLQTGSGGVRVWAAPEPLRHSHAAVGAVLGASTR